MITSYIDFYNSLQYTFFISTNNVSLLRNWNNRTNNAWSGFFRQSFSLNEIFSFWKPKISFAEMFHECIEKQFKGTLPGRRQWKWWKMLLISTWKLFSFSKYLSFCFDILVMYKKGFIRKIRLISKFMTSQPG